MLDVKQLPNRWNTNVHSNLEPVKVDMDWTRLTLIAVLSIAAILAGLVISDVAGQTVLFSHGFPKTPHGL